jgi:hypothetical protein
VGCATTPYNRPSRSFGDVPLGDVVQPGITVIAQDPVALGRHAARLLRAARRRTGRLTAGHRSHSPDCPRLRRDPRLTRNARTRRDDPVWPRPRRHRHAQAITHDRQAMSQSCYNLGRDGRLDRLGRLPRRYARNVVVTLPTEGTSNDPTDRRSAPAHLQRRLHRARGALPRCRIRSSRRVRRPPLQPPPPPDVTRRVRSSSAPPLEQGPEPHSGDVQPESHRRGADDHLATPSRAAAGDWRVSRDRHRPSPSPRRCRPRAQTRSWPRGHEAATRTRSNTPAALLQLRERRVRPEPRVGPKQLGAARASALAVRDQFVEETPDPPARCSPSPCAAGCAAPPACRRASRRSGDSRAGGGVAERDPCLARP